MTSHPNISRSSDHITVHKQYNKDFYDAVNHKKKSTAAACSHANQQGECFCGALTAGADVRLGCVEYFRLAARQ